MSEIALRRLINPTPEDLDEAAETLALAFADDTMTHMLAGGDRSQILPLRRAMLAGYDAIGEIWIADAPGPERGERSVAGVAAFVRPGKDPLESAEQRESMERMIQRLSEGARAWWVNEMLPKVRAHELQSVGEGTGRAAWNLYTLGTRPEYRGRGVGRALTEVINRKAAADGTRVTLRIAEETTHVLEFYRRLGYEERGEPVLLESPWGRTWARAMVREPAA